MLLFDPVRADKIFLKPIPGSINISNDKLEAKMADLPRDKDIIFICSTGSRAGEAYYMVKDKYPDAQNVYYLEGTIKFNDKGGYQISPNSGAQ